jgi:TatD DNase family protein
MFRPSNNKITQKKEAKKMFVDAHCHMDSVDVEKNVENAKKAGVHAIISASSNLTNCKKNLELQKKFSSIHACIGIHPQDTTKMSTEELKKTIKFIEENASSSIAIGEIGLDFKATKNKEERNIQRETFRKLIKIAKEKNKPMVVHSRYSAKNVLEILEEEKAKKVLMHWFTHSKKDALHAISNGYYISAGSSTLFNTNSDDTLKEIPPEKLLLETDAPVPFGEKTSEPAWIPLIAKRISEIKNMPLKKIEEQVQKNSLNFFGSKILM